MRGLGSFFLLAVAVCSAAVVPGPAPEVAQVAQVAQSELLERAASDNIELYRRQKWVGCLFNFPLFHVNQNNRQSFQPLIDNETNQSFDLGEGIQVSVNAEYVQSDRHIGLIITNSNILPLQGSIVLSNYRDTRATTTARVTVEVDHTGETTRTCIRLPRLDGTWYLQRSL
ncbi:hypothetical protein E4U30_002908 [Claviceps sp. LM220 group G6]|nr:hypothetical protein E4U15_008320 [Claviceps sp. LM218 group G6]KAG6094956.1 hypothetical protein E4U30_002908 [Claviceps sp. LM220 group G6]KAG6109424.1 hypothetical protein E4U31_006894 [Claviceps sp. LM219 group G6]